MWITSQFGDFVNLNHVLSVIVHENNLQAILPDLKLVGQHRIFLLAVSTNQDELFAELEYIREAIINKRPHYTVSIKPSSDSENQSARE